MRHTVRSPSATTQYRPSFATSCSPGCAPAAAAIRARRDSLTRRGTPCRCKPGGSTEAQQVSLERSSASHHSNTHVERSACCAVSCARGDAGRDLRSALCRLRVVSRVAQKLLDRLALLTLGKGVELRAGRQKAVRRDPRQPPLKGCTGTLCSPWRSMTEDVNDTVYDSVNDLSTITC
jgi:hypothetical protein